MFVLYFLLIFVPFVQAASGTSPAILIGFWFAFIELFTFLSNLFLFQIPSLFLLNNGTEFL